MLKLLTLSFHFILEVQLSFFFFFNKLIKNAFAFSTLCKLAMLIL